MPEPEPKDVVPFVIDLRTGTEVHPDVVAHYADYLQGAQYYQPAAPAPQTAAPAEEAKNA